MKVNTVINGKVVEIEGTPEEIKEFLNDKPQLQQPITQDFDPKKFKEMLDKLSEERAKDVIYNPNQKYGYPIPYYNPICTCNSVWLMVGPIPPCPVHGCGQWSYPITYTINCSGGKNTVVSERHESTSKPVFIPTIFTDKAQ